MRTSVKDLGSTKRWLKVVVGLTAVVAVGNFVGFFGLPKASSQTPGDLPVSTRWYFDRDGDGFGDWYTHLDSADQPARYVSNPADCNDRNVEVNPSKADAPGIDANCDARLDQGWGQRPRPVGQKGPRFDLDGDGAKALADGGTDCNDSDPDVFYGNPEFVNNLKDNDCDLLTMDGGYNYPRSEYWLVPFGSPTDFSFPPDFDDRVR